MKKFLKTGIEKYFKHSSTIKGKGKRKFW